MPTSQLRHVALSLCGRPVVNTLDWLRGLGLHEVSRRERRVTHLHWPLEDREKIDEMSFVDDVAGCVSRRPSGGRETSMPRMPFFRPSNGFGGVLAQMLEIVSWRWTQRCRIQVSMTC